MSAFNLAPGVTLTDINGPPMPRCTNCGQEFTPKRDEAVCDECYETYEMEK